MIRFQPAMHHPPAATPSTLAAALSQRSRWRSFGLLAALAGAAAGASAQTRDAGREPAEAERDSRNGPDLGRFVAARFHSQSLDREVGYGVHLPPGYDQDTDKRYPVVYWLHGMFEDSQRFDRRGGTRILQDLYQNGLLPPIIIACADGGRTSFYCNGVESGPNEDLIVKDFIPYVEKTYRTLGNRAGRAISGTSMGGNGALRIAFKYPQMFIGVATHSAALFPVELDKLDPRFRRILDAQFGQQFKEIWGDPIDPARWAQDNPMALAERLTPDKLDGLQIYADCGQSDRYRFNAPHTDLHDLLEARKIEHVWREVPGGHGWGDGYLTRYLPSSLGFLSKAFANAARTSAPSGSDGKGASSRPDRDKR